VIAALRSRTADDRSRLNQYPPGRKGAPTPPLSPPRTKRW